MKTATAAKSQVKTHKGPTKKRIAIVGGGISGLYTAWRLLQDQEQSYEVHLFEMDSRVGGRIRSEPIPGIPFLAELGAMRFRTRHQILNSLVRELGIPTCSFDLPSPVYHLRGRRLTVEELSSGVCDRCKAGHPFLLREVERGKSPVELVRNVIDTVLRGLSFPGLAQGEAQRVARRVKDHVISAKTWEAVKREGVYQGVHLYSLGFWNLLQHFLSNEAFTMVRDVLSLESILGNWNAAEAIPWFLEDFASDQYEMIPGGMARITDSLREKIEVLNRGAGASSCEIHCGQHVQLIERRGKRWSVACQDAGAGEFGQFDNVILALPKVALQRLKVSGLDWPPQWFGWVREHRMFKLFLLYDHEWWIGDNLPGYDNGRVFTDLPLRQIYYFSPSWMLKHGDPHRRLDQQKKPGKYDNLALVMASYSDEHYVSFWEPMLADAGLHPGLRLDQDQPYRHQSSKVSAELWKEMATINPSVLASKRMVDKVQMQLTEIHGKDLPQPILGVYRDWGGYPFGGGWHTWVVGSRPWEFEDARVEPTPGQGLFLCGEAYSKEQGWMEGALKSAELVLGRLSAGRPRWVNEHEVEGFNSYIGVPHANSI